MTKKRDRTDAFRQLGEAMSVELYQNILKERERRYREPVAMLPEEFRMKTLTDHQTNDCNNAITITCDAPDEKYDNASHSYLCRWKEKDNCPYSTEIKFQRGPIQEVGVNGLTNEVLLAIVIDRLRGFQSGAFACRDNALALTKVEEALMWLANRTRGRVARGVEGTNVV